MKKDVVKINIERYDPREKRRYVQSYLVPRGSKLRVLDFLNYIFEELDPSLAYRRHFCKARLCQGCLMEVDGKPRLICWELIPPGQEEITLSPIKKKRVFKDLIVDSEG